MNIIDSIELRDIYNYKVQSRTCDHFFKTKSVSRLIKRYPRPAPLIISL